MEGHQKLSVVSGEGMYRRMQRPEMTFTFGYNFDLNYCLWFLHIVISEFDRDSFKCSSKLGFMFQRFLQFSNGEFPLNSMTTIRVPKSRKMTRAYAEATKWSLNDSSLFSFIENGRKRKVRITDAAPFCMKTTKSSSPRNVPCLVTSQIHSAVSYTFQPYRYCWW